jgi:hypothetical protein
MGQSAATTQSDQQTTWLFDEQSGQNVGIKEVAEKIWLVSFTDYDLGFLITRQVASNVPQTRSALICYPCPRLGPSGNGRGDRI